MATLSERREAYAHCDCATMEFGNTIVTVNRNIEQVDRSIGGHDAGVTVIQSDTVLTLCAACGNRFNLDTLAAIVRSGCTRH